METVEENAEKCVRRDSRSTLIGLNWAVQCAEVGAGLITIKQISSSFAQLI
jgi:hypothetical protein